MVVIRDQRPPKSLAQRTAQTLGYTLCLTDTLEGPGRVRLIDRGFVIIHQKLSRVFLSCNRLLYKSSVFCFKSSFS